MKVEQFVAELKKGAGSDRAIKIAEARMRATHPSTRADLPKGPIFTEKDKKGKLPMSDAHITYLHNFWTHAYHVLRKQEKK